MKGSNSRGNLEGNAGLQSEIEALLLQQQQQQQQQNRNLILQRERELDINRSGSAPPTVEGALSAAGNLFRYPDFTMYGGSGSGANTNASIGLLSEEEIRSHPAYLEYYYSPENINPRLPPPLLSREDWRVAQRLMAAGFDLGGNLGENRGGLSLLSAPPGIQLRKPDDDMMELRKAALMNLSRKNSTESLEKLALMNMSRKNSVESLDKAVLMNLSQKNSVEALEKALLNVSRRNSVESLEKAAALMNMSRKNSVESMEKAAALMNMPRMNSVESLEKAALVNRKFSVDSLEKAALLNLSRKTSVESLDNAALANQSKKSNAESLENGSSTMNGASSSGMGVRRKSFADIVQEGLSHPKSNLSRTSSHNSVSDALDSTKTNNSQGEETQNKTAETLEALAAMSNPTSLRSPTGSSFPTNINSAAALNASNFHSPGIFEIADAAASLSGLHMSNGQLHLENLANSLLQMGIPISHHQNLLQHYGDISRAKNLADHLNNISLMGANGSTSGLNVPVNFPKRTSSTTNLQLPHSPSDFATLEDLKMLYQNSQLPRSGNQMGLHYRALDPHQLQYLQKMSNHGANLAQMPGNTSKGIFHPGNHHGLDEFQALEKAYLEALLLQQAQQYQPHYLQKNGMFNHQCPSYAPYQENLVLSPPTSGMIPRGSAIQNDKSVQMASTLRNIKGEATSPSQTSSNTKGKAESLLEVLKSSKSKTLELSDILGHVLEFSTDQFGSRFIQQKLATATVEEKTKVLTEIIPHAHDLMVDVFGNYVIQKFFEHGTQSQQNELARHMIGHVMPLTLQMYGCRVVQKALEVVDVELQAKMVKELDGSVMKCVYDQNGNHVIQKCIECVPQENIQFIISAFLGQIVTLSTHPYGCRVIQRVLEHCTDPKTEQIIMDEILNSVCKLAQDQYGNYVIQHVVQHGKTHERSMIISKLAGQIVKMSLQKFASNVIEKCLTYCTPEERQILINEILGSTDENEPLQAMMKDPFGNYVVQKVILTCDDKSRELIISRIKVHLSSLKKYTYGKHIVSRVEKLIATGEKHGGHSSSPKPT